jgi:hypothetical protein
MSVAAFWVVTPFILWVVAITYLTQPTALQNFVQYSFQYYSPVNESVSEVDFSTFVINIVQDFFISYMLLVHSIETSFITSL